MPTGSPETPEPAQRAGSGRSGRFRDRTQHDRRHGEDVVSDEPDSQGETLARARGDSRGQRPADHLTHRPRNASRPPLRRRRRVAPAWALVAFLSLFAIPSLAQAQGQAGVSNLTAGVTGCHVTLSWDAPTEDAAAVTGYQVLRAQGDGQATILEGDTMSTSTTYTDSTVEDGETYTYQVRARRGGMAGEESDTVEVTIPEAPAPMDVAVTTVPIVATSTVADYFVLYVSHDKDGTEVEIPVLVKKGAAGTTTLAENIEALPKERYRLEKYLIDEPADVDGDCIDDITELDDLGDMNPVNPATAIELNDGIVTVPDQETFKTLAYEYSGKMFIKVVLLDTDTDRPSIYFTNVKTHAAHNHFLDAVGIDRSKLALGEGLVYGTIEYDLDGSPGGYYFWLRPSNTYYSVARMEYFYTLLAASMPLLDDNLAVYMGNSQLRFLQPNLPLYSESRIPLVFDKDIYPETSFLALNPGEGYGLLRVMEPKERPNPRDIVIYEALPNELPRVAGVISTVPQTPLTHVNLRAVQDRIPNAFIRKALDQPAIASLLESYVHYTVTKNGYTIQAATKTAVDNHYASSRPTRPQTPQRDLSVTSITPLSEIGFGDWRAFGVKAANVAEMRKLSFPAGTVPDGYAIPFYFYDEFMKHNDFYTRIQSMLDDADFQDDYDTQEDKLKKLRKAIENAETPEWILTALTDMNKGFPDGINRRYRSSTNNEDLPGFNGAGLYDSKSQKPSEDEEDLAKSLKEVYASLWTFRAFIERDFHRVDHLKTAMGILVHPSYQDELANGVAVSIDPATGETDDYYVNTQLGEDLVTNPEAHSVPEEIMLHPNRYTVLASSNLVKPGRLLMSDAQLTQLHEHLITIHDHFERLYKPGPNEPFAMEIEFKITSDNVLAIKQARPWVFSDAPARPPPPIIIITPVIITGGGGGGGPSGPSPSEVDFEWTVKRDIEALDGGNDWPTGLWSDGETLWIAENGQGADDEVYAYDRASGERLSEREFDAGRGESRAPRLLVRRRDRLGLRQRPRAALRLPPGGRGAARGARVRARRGQQRCARHLVGREDDVGAGRPRRRALRLRLQERRTARRVRPRLRQRRSPRHLVRRRDRVGLRPWGEAPLRLQAAGTRGSRGRRHGTAGPRARPRRGVQQAEPGQQQQPARHLVRRRLHVRRRRKRRPRLHLQHARRDRRPSRVAHAQRRRHRRVRSRHDGVRGLSSATACGGDGRDGRGDAAPHGCRHRPARRRRRRGERPPGCTGRARRDHRHRDLAGRQPQEGLPRAVPRDRVGPGPRSLAALPARRGLRGVQPRRLRGGQRRGVGQLRGEPAHRGLLRPA